MHLGKTSQLLRRLDEDPPQYESWVVAQSIFPVKGTLADHMPCQHRLWELFTSRVRKAKSRAARIFSWTVSGPDVLP